MSWSPEERVASRQAHRDAGLCIYCSNYAEIGQVCSTHWFMRMAKRLLGKSTMANAYVLKETFVAAKATCAYTGVELTFSTAYPVHRVPLSRGGLRTPGNIEWVRADVAKAKGDLTPEEFRSLCCQVASASLGQSEGD